MNKAFGKILLGLCLTAQLVLGKILVDLERETAFEPLDSSNRLVCQSNNDPHMVNFWNEPFEYQAQVKDKCLHQTKYYQVSANFQPCGASVTCNCAVKISLSNGQQAFINNCGNSGFPTHVLSFSSGADVTCDTVSNPLFNPLIESEWSTIPTSSGNAFFLCAIASNGITYIKTKLSPSSENVIVQIFPGMSSLFVHASNSYTASPTYNRKCLCENKIDMIGHQFNLIDEIPKEIDMCKERLLNDCFEILLQSEGLLTPQRVEAIENLIANCASDLKLSGGRIEVGFFQHTEIQNQIKEAILEASGNRLNQDFLRKFCECQLSKGKEYAEICEKILN